MRSEYFRIINTMPDKYKKTRETKSLTYYQLLIILKHFLQKDTENEGKIKFSDLMKILQDLKFNTSEEEIEAILRNDNEDINEDIHKETFSYDTLTYLCDLLKREKLVLVQLSNSFNYLIFSMLLILIVVYISNFYQYKYNSN